MPPSSTSRRARRRSPPSRPWSRAPRGRRTGCSPTSGSSGGRRGRRSGSRRPSRAWPRAADWPSARWPGCSGGPPPSSSRRRSRWRCPAGCARHARSRSGRAPGQPRRHRGGRAGSRDDDGRDAMALSRIDAALVVPEEAARWLAIGIEDADSCWPTWESSQLVEWSEVQKVR